VKNPLAGPRRFRGVTAGPSGFRGAALVLLTFAVGLACVEQADDPPTPEDLEVIKQNLLGAVPTPRFKVNANLGDKLVYLGLDSSLVAIEPGRPVALTHYWQVKEPPGKDWRIFTHVQGPGGAGFTNADHIPVRGKFPVSQWKAGDIVRDVHTVNVPSSWTSGSLEVYVGLWRGAERMPIKSGPHDQQGRVLAATIPVKRPTPEAQQGPAIAAKRYLVQKTLKPIKIDGVLEAAWNKAPWTQPFVAPVTGQAGAARSSAKFLWDDKNLYIAIDNADSDIWGDLKTRDADLTSQEAVQVLLDANANDKSYIELQVSPNNSLFDAFLPEPRKYENALDPQRKPYDWTSTVKHAVKVDGTLNKRDDQDRSWTVEMALPLADVNGLAKAGAKVPPGLGEAWRVNLARYDAPKGKDQTVLVWSPPMGKDLHALDHFGQIVFVDANGFAPLTAHGSPDKLEEEIRAAHEGLHGGLPVRGFPARVKTAETPPKPPTGK
jgi:hypothetical protein